MKPLHIIKVLSICRRSMSELLVITCQNYLLVSIIIQHLTKLMWWIRIRINPYFKWFHYLELVVNCFILFFWPCYRYKANIKIFFCLVTQFKCNSPNILTIMTQKITQSFLKSSMQKCRGGTILTMVSLEWLYLLIKWWSDESQCMMKCTI